MDKFNKKILKSLENFKRSHHVWEWSDLSNWLISITKQLQRNQSRRLSSLTTEHLSKRLFQCLNPQLPESVHSHALEAYFYILLDAPTESYIWFSSGLFSFFEYASMGNKRKFLDLLREIFLPKEEELINIFPGMIGSLLMGADESYELSILVKDLLNTIKNREIVIEIVWACVRNCKQMRIAGLKYLIHNWDSCLFREAASKALVVCFEDTDVKVLSISLDLVIKHFPVDKEHEDLSEIGNTVFKLLRYPDFKLRRRIWEWSCPENEISTHFAKQSVLKLLDYYKENMELHCDSDFLKIEIIDIIDILLRNENIGQEILPYIAVQYIHLVIKNELYTIKGSFSQKCLLMLCGRNSEVFWEVFIMNLHQFDLKTVGFFIQNTSVSAENVLRIHDYLLLNLDIQRLDQEVLQFCLESDVEDYPMKGASHINSLFLSLISPAGMLQLSRLLGKYKELGFNTEAAESYIISLGLFEISSIKALINLKSKIITQEFVLELWKRVGSQHELSSLLWDCFDLVPGKWTDSLISILQSDEKLNGIIHFTQLCSSQKQIPNFSNEKLLFTLIDLAFDTSPIIRFAASKWLSLMKSHVSTLLDPFLCILLNTETEMQDNLLVYKIEIDPERIIGTLQRLKIIMDKKMKKVLDKSELSTLVANKMKIHDIKAENYMGLIVECLVIHLLVDSAYGIKLKVCETLEDLVKNISVKNAVRVLDVCNFSLSKAIETDDPILQSLHIKIIQNILFFTKIESSPCANLFQSEHFSFYFLKGIHTSDGFLRGIWASFISNLIPFLVHFLTHPVLPQYMTSIQQSFQDMILGMKDIQLLEKLGDIIHSCLGINKRPIKPGLNFVKKYGIELNILEGLEQLILISTSVVQLVEAEDSRRSMKTTEIFAIIGNILKPICSAYPEHLVNALIGVWTGFCIEQSKEALTILMNIILSCNLGIIQFLKIAKKYLKKADGKELCTGHLIFTFLQFQDSLTCLEFWNDIKDILELLLDSQLEESIAIVLSILKQLTLNDINTEKINRTAAKAYTKACGDVLSADQYACNVLYPNVTKQKIRVHSLVLHSLIESIPDVPKAFLKERQDKVFTEIAQKILNKLKNCEIATGSTLASEFLDKVLKLDTNIVQYLAEDCIEFIISPNFFSLCEIFPECFDIWRSILNRISECFTLKSTMDRALKALSPKFYDSPSKVSTKFKHSFLVKSIMFLSSKDEKSEESIEIAIVDLKKGLETSENIPYVLVFIRSLLITIDKLQFKKIWFSVWGELHVLLIQYLKGLVNFEICLAILKLIDTLIVVGYEDFYSVLWVYFFDVPEIELVGGDNFMPIATKLIVGAARPTKLNRIQTKTKQRVLRYPHVDATAIQSREELFKYAQTLIQVCMYYNSTLTSYDLVAVEKSLQADIIALNNSNL